MYAVEVEVLDSLEAPDRDKLLLEAAQAYRYRGNYHQARGRPAAAEADGKRADKLEAQARKAAGLGQIAIVNGWTEPAAVVVDGVEYQLRKGEQRLLSRKAGPFTYELPAANLRGTRVLEAGQKYTLRIGPR